MADRYDHPHTCAILAGDPGSTCPVLRSGRIHHPQHPETPVLEAD